MDSSPPCVSFIGIVDFSQEARWIYMTDSVSDLLGYEPSELVGRPSLELVHPDEFSRVKQMHYDTIRQDKAAVLAYLRMKHKDPYKGYILCGISRTVVHNVLVGSVSFASPGAKALHNASTAQEIEVVTPHALQNFQFKRWNDPSPMPPSPVPRNISLPPSSPSNSTRSRSRSRSRSPTVSSAADGDRSPSPISPRSPPRSSSSTGSTLIRRPGVITFDRLPNQSLRTAFILDRFSLNCSILYCSNDLLISTTHCIGRSFYDFVSKKDEDVVREWITVIKSWGVNERGQPSDGGFGFGKFSLLKEGRDSIGRVPEPAPTRHRHGSTAGSRSSRTTIGNSRSSGHRDTHGGSHPHHHHHRERDRDRDRDYGKDRDRRDYGRPRQHTTSARTLSPLEDSEQIVVDAIFSAHSDGLMVILRRASDTR